MENLGFREFIDGEFSGYKYDEVEVANLYFQRQLTVREISSKTGRSIGEIYRILKRYGEPNRRSNNRGTVISLADSGLGLKTIADITGYTPRHIRNILKQRYDD
jgi:hypothetical protein